MAKEYVISEILNNNVILVVDNKRTEELILVGKGIGFGKKAGYSTKLSEIDIEKSFISCDEERVHEYLQLINQVDINIINLSDEIIAEAEKELGQLNLHIHIDLADHTGFTLERIKNGYGYS